MTPHPAYCLQPTMRPYLENVQEVAEPGRVYAITRYHDTNETLRTQLLQIIWRPGMEEW